MARTPDLTYAIDGLPLDDPTDRWWILDDTTVSPGMVRNTISIIQPGIDGAMPWWDETVGEMNINLVMAFRPVAGISAEMHRRSLVNFINRTNRAVVLKRTLFGLVTYADAKVTGIGESERDEIGDYLLSTISFTVPGGFFRDQADLTWASVSPPVTGTTYEVTTLAGSAGAIKDAVFRLTGPWVAPKITDIESGTGFLLGNIASGHRVIVDAYRYTARDVTTDVWTGGTDISGTLSAFGLASSIRPITLAPDANLSDPTDTAIKVKTEAGSTIAAGAKLEVRARRVYPG